MPRAQLGQYCGLSCNAEAQLPLWLNRLGGCRGGIYDCGWLDLINDCEDGFKAALDRGDVLA